MLDVRDRAGGPPILLPKAELEPLLAAGHVHKDCNGCLVMLSNDNARQHNKLLPVYDNPESEVYTQMSLLHIHDLALQSRVERVGQRWCSVICPPGS